MAIWRVLEYSGFRNIHVFVSWCFSSSVGWHHCTAHNNLAVHGGLSGFMFSPHIVSICNSRVVCKGSAQANICMLLSWGTSMLELRHNSIPLDVILYFIWMSWNWLHLSMKLSPKPFRYNQTPCQKLVVDNTKNKNEEKSLVFELVVRNISRPYQKKLEKPHLSWMSWTLPSYRINWFCLVGTWALSVSAIWVWRFGLG